LLTTNVICSGIINTLSLLMSFPHASWIFHKFHSYKSVEIPTRCKFVIEFIIPKFTEGSTCFERHTAHHQEL
jgi:hypothetical protein